MLALAAEATSSARFIVRRQASRRARVVAVTVIAASVVSAAWAGLDRLMARAAAVAAICQPAVEGSVPGATPFTSFVIFRSRGPELNTFRNGDDSLPDELAICTFRKRTTTICSCSRRTTGGFPPSSF
jgi:hypothetical protein